MRILFVHEVNYLKKVVFEMHEIPEKLSERGHEVHFVDFPEGEPASLTSIRTQSRVIQGRTNHGVQIHLHRLPRFLPQPLDRLFTAATCYFSLQKLFKAIRPDVVVVYGVPTNGWQSLLAARRQSIPCVYRAIDVSHKLRNSVFNSLVLIAEKFMYRNAVEVFANNDSLASYGIQSGCAPSRMKVQVPGFEFVSRELKPIVSTRTVVFMGTFFRFAGLSWFIKDFSRLAIEDSSLRIRLVGDGEDSHHLRTLVQKLSLQDIVEFVGFVSFQKLHETLRSGTVAILPFDEVPVAMNALPGKVPQYILSGLPTVSTRLTGLMSLFPEGVGVTYAAPGPDFVDRVRTLLDNQAEREGIVSRGQELLAESFSWDRVIKEFECALLKLGTS